MPTMKIGNLQLTSNLIQAPLAGYSSAPLRVLAHKYGTPGFCCTEMMSAMSIHLGAKQKKRFTYKDKAEGLLCFQLAVYKPEAMQSAAIHAVANGADLIDLNCGCPQPKIRKKNMGSKLLSQSKLLYQLIKVIKASAALPVTVKIRVDALSGDRYNLDVADAAQQAGADAIIVHGRHWQERYDVACHTDDIAAIKQHVSIPVIGNGDIKDTASARHMFTKTNCDAVMIARDSVGQPWLFAKIRAELQGKTFTPPTIKMIGDRFLEHVRGLIALEGETMAILQSRKLGKYYARNHVSADFLTKLYTATNYATVAEVTTAYFCEEAK